MNIKRKNRTMPRYPTGEARQPRGMKPIVAQGVYNNSYFMHAATALVGHLVEVHLRSGNVYEGLFRTFSPHFDVALELPHCVKSVNKSQTDENKNSTKCIIFSYDNIVNIIAKNFDPNYVYGGTFQTDNLISERCNGTGRADEKELEPWDPGMNGGVDLELDGNENGWDADEMFSKNEKNFGVHSTFDDSLSDYTLPIDKDAAEYLEREAQAEKLAQEIESNPSTKDRLNLENGDEESLFAAVERPERIVEQSQKNLSENKVVVHPSGNGKPKSNSANISSNVPLMNITQVSQTQPNNASENLSGCNINNNNKIISTTSNCEKYFPQQKRKIIKVPRLSSTNNNTSGVTHSTGKTSYSSSLQPALSNSQQYGTYNMSPHSVQYRNNNGSQNKSNNENGVNLPANVGNSLNKSTSQRPIRSYGGCNYGDQQNQVALMNASHVVIQPQVQVLSINQNANGISHNQNDQRVPRHQREGIEVLKKFQQSLNIVYNTNIIPASGTQQSVPKHTQIPVSPNLQINKPQQSINTESKLHNNDLSPQQQTTPSSVQKEQGYQNQTPNNTDVSINHQLNTSSVKQTAAIGNDSLVEKSTPPTVTKKHVLNPSAKIFTPRSPSTPNQSRPHTPQTPGPALPSTNMFTTGAHVSSAQHPMYVIPHPQQAFSQAAGHAGVQVQPARLRRPQLAGPMHVSAAAATGQPLMSASFLHYQQGSAHPSHFQGQPYQPMVRYYPDPSTQPVQFLAQTPPSTTPSPGQHQQYHPPPPSPQTATSAFVPGAQGAAPQPTHYQMVPLIQPQLVPHYYQTTGQNPHQAQQFQLVMSQHASQ